MISLRVNVSRSCATLDHFADQVSCLVNESMLGLKKAEAGSDLAVPKKKAKRKEQWKKKQKDKVKETKKAKAED
jgi:hypothetical protein